MLCEKCGKNQATFHYTEFVNGNKNEHHLCGECAANTDVSYYSSVFDNDQFGKLLSGIFGNANFMTGEKEKDPACNVQCPNCKMTYGEFINTSAFGCAECYDVFGPLISDKIKKLQGSNTHVGKRPMLYNRDERSVMEEEITELKEEDIRKETDYLSKKLKEAVAVEDFEEAARLRDKIAELRRKEEKDA